MLFENWKDSAFSVIPVYKDLISAGLKIWLFRYLTNFFLLLFPIGEKQHIEIFFYVLCFLFLVFFVSGDVDAVVPITGTRYGVESMNLTKTEDWFSWYVNGQVSVQNSFHICFEGF